MIVPTNPTSTDSARSESILSLIGEFIAEKAIDPDRNTLTTVRDALIDLLGCILAGANDDLAQKSRKALRNRHGSAAVYGTSTTLAPEAAALVNAVAGHTFDFDDWEIPGNTHPSVTIIPALLAAMEGRCLSGREFAEAYIVGFEIIARLGESMNFEHYDAGWHTTGTFGCLGAAAAVARLWNLNAAQSANAVGIATSRAGGLTAQFGSDAKPLQAGFAAESGVVSALLARENLTAHRFVLQGCTGFNALTSHGDDAALQSAFGNLGEPLSLKTHGLVFKPYPSCGYTHRAVDAALALRENISENESIEKIEIFIPDFHAAVLPFHRPGCAREARFSLPFNVALALLRGRISMDEFNTKHWMSEDVEQLMGKTVVKPFAPKNPGLNYDPEQPDCVRIHFASGRSFEQSIAYPLGAPQRPMSSSEILNKFIHNSTECSAAAVRSLSNWLNTNDLLTILQPWR